MLEKDGVHCEHPEKQVVRNGTLHLRQENTILSPLLYIYFTPSVLREAVSREVVTKQR